MLMTYWFLDILSETIVFFRRKLKGPDIPGQSAEARQPANRDEKVVRATEIPTRPDEALANDPPEKPNPTTLSH